MDIISFQILELKRLLYNGILRFSRRRPTDTWRIIVLMGAYLVESIKLEIYNVFPCNIASSKHAESWENRRVALRFPSKLFQRRQFYILGNV